MVEEIMEEGTSEITPEEGETSEIDEEKAAEGEGKEPNWKAKANAMYGKYKETKEKLEELEKKLAEKEKPQQQVSDDEWKQRVEFLLEHKDYAEDEYNHISTVAKEFDISLEEAAELEQDYIQYRREKVAKEKQQLEPSTRTSPSQTPIEQIPVEKLKELTPEQREEWYRKVGIKRR
jgi:hypothetical protein